MKISLVELLFAEHVRDAKLPPHETEYRFSPPRRWRFDVCWKYPYWLAVELEGGTFSNGRHTRGAGFENDCEKYNTAVLQGWRVLRFTSQMVSTGQAINTTIAALNRKKSITEQT